jgi:hypothetical protein
MSTCQQYHTPIVIGPQSFILPLMPNNKSVVERRIDFRRKGGH